jgi:hypothetical protein
MAPATSPATSGTNRDTVTQDSNGSRDWGIGLGEVGMTTYDSDWIRKDPADGNDPGSVGRTK